MDDSDDFHHYLEIPLRVSIVKPTLVQSRSFNIQLARHAGTLRYEDVVSDACSRYLSRFVLSLDIRKLRGFMVSKAAMTLLTTFGHCWVLPVP